MNAIAALITAGVALVVLYAWAALRYRRRARDLVDEWERYSLEREDGPDGLVAFHVDGTLVDLEAARPDYFATDGLIALEEDHA